MKAGTALKFNSHGESLRGILGRLMLRRTSYIIAALGLVLGLTGCKSIGPGSVPRDRSDYSDAISESWMRQTDGVLFATVAEINGLKNQATYILT